MSIDVRTYPNRTDIIVLVFPEDWTQADVLRAATQMQQHILKHKLPTSIVLDMNKSDTVPRGFFQAVQTLHDDINQYLKRIILVMDWQTSTLILGVVRRLAQPLAANIEVAKTLAGAFKLIDPSLDRNNSSVT